MCSVFLSKTKSFKEPNSSWTDVREERLTSDFRQLLLLIATLIRDQWGSFMEVNPVHCLGHAGASVPGGALHQGGLQEVGWSQSLPGTPGATGQGNRGSRDHTSICVRHRCCPEGNTHTTHTHGPYGVS